MNVRTWFSVITLLIILFLTLTLTLAIQNTAYGQSQTHITSAGRLTDSTYGLQAIENLTQQNTFVIESYDPNDGLMIIRNAFDIRGFSGSYSNWWFDPGNIVDPPSFSWTGNANCIWSTSNTRIECSGQLLSLEFSYRWGYTPTVQSSQIVHRIGFTWFSGAIADMDSHLYYPENMTYITSTTTPNIQENNHLYWKTPDTTQFQSDVTFEVPTEGEGVSIELRAFIPCEAITINLGEGFDIMGFAGDGYSMRTFRALQNVTVDAPPDDTPPNDLIISGPDRFWGTSKRYRLSQMERAINRPSWCWKFKEGEYNNPWYSNTLPVTDSNNRVRVYQYPLIKETYVDLFIDGGNPAAVPFPEGTIPNLNANVRVDIRKNNGEYQYKLRGAHDGFPAYYLYINGTRVHCYDPLEEGGSPWYLGGGLDVAVNDFENWHNVSDAQDCDRPLGVRLSYPEVGVGGWTTLTGISFPPDSNISIHINNKLSRSLTVDGTGKFKVILNTTSADEGIYNISVKGNSSSINTQAIIELASAQLIVNGSYPIYEKDSGIAVEITIPHGIAEPWRNFLPIVSR